MSIAAKASGPMKKPAEQAGKAAATCILQDINYSSMFGSKKYLDKIKQFSIDKQIR